ncbi:MAG: PIN domain-containing protein [Trueperaceae bacterium]|nr:PIN domain-containing protein [Trueperaceae bacterium]
MTLVDTSVWVAHLRGDDPGLAARLDAVEVYAHPFVTGELACGRLARRDEVLTLLDRLPQAPRADDAEVRTLLELRGLHGRGIGWVDAHLLASALLAAAPLWTLDRRLHEVAAALGVAARPRAA